MTIKSIEERLFEQSDKELKAQIESAAKQLDTLLRNGTAHDVSIKHGGSLIEAGWWECLAALKDKAFIMHADKHREAHLRAFMDKITQFSTDYQSIQSVIDGPEAVNE